MKKQLKRIPRFKTEAEGREFWQTHDSTEYVDWSKAKGGIQFPNLKLTTKIDIPYQSLIKKYIFDALAK